MNIIPLLWVLFL